MTKKEAIKIMCNEEIESIYYCGYEEVIVSKQDIKTNLECSDYELDLDFTQDFMTTDGQMLQGHSLAELEKDPY